MTQNPMPVGYRACTNPKCGRPVHYRVKVCKACMTKQVRDMSQAEPQPLRDASGVEIVRAQESAAGGEAQQPQVVTPPAPPPAAAPPRDLLSEAFGPLVQPPAASASAAAPQARVVEALPGQEGAYYVLENFNGQVDNVLCVLRRGMVLTDTNLIAQLRQIGAPIVPASQVDDLVCCPNCRTVFQPAKAAAQESKRRVG